MDWRKLENYDLSAFGSSFKEWLWNYENLHGFLKSLFANDSHFYRHKYRFETQVEPAVSTSDLSPDVRVKSDEEYSFGGISDFPLPDK